MAAFLYNGERKYSYEVLINTINQHQEYFPLYKAPDLFSYFVNLIKAVVTNSPLVLLDSDLNLSEVPGIEESMVNKPTKLTNYHFSDMTAVLSALRQSTSEITIFTFSPYRREIRRKSVGIRLQSYSHGRIAGILSGI